MFWLLLVCFHFTVLVCYDGAAVVRRLGLCVPVLSLVMVVSGRTSNHNRSCAILSVPVIIQPVCLQGNSPTPPCLSGGVISALAVITDSSLECWFVTINLSWISWLCLSFREALYVPLPHLLTYCFLFIRWFWSIKWRLRLTGQRVSWFRRSVRVGVMSPRIEFFCSGEEVSVTLISSSHRAGRRALCHIA